MEQSRLATYTEGRCPCQSLSKPTNGVLGVLSVVGRREPAKRLGAPRRARAGRKRNLPNLGGPDSHRKAY